MVTDFHNHILPKIDDGSRSVEESIAMLQMMVQQGVQTVIATPHFYPQDTTPDRFLEKREAAMDRLLEQLTQNDNYPEIRLGAEVFYYDQMSHSEELRKLTIEGINAILIEMPMGQWTDRMYQELENIQKNLSLTPIVAHVDRYLGRFRDYGIPQRLSELPVLVQANAEFVLKHTGKALRMLQGQQIQLLGSDCHNLTDRKPNLGEAVELIRKKLGNDVIELIQSTERMLFEESKD